MEPPGSQTLLTATETASTVIVPSVSAAAALHLPPFWRQNPRSWFRQVEAQFQLRNIHAQSTKYFHVIANLPPEVAAELDDILSTVPLDEAYDVLKSAILDRMQASQRSRIQQLLNEEDLGDRKPSQMLHHMRQLLGNPPPESQQPLLRELFLQRLPQGMRMVLAGSDDFSLDKLATLADRIADYSTPSHTPLVATAAPPVSSRFDQIEARLQELTNALQALQRRPRSPARQRRSPSQQRGTSPPPPTQSTAPLCWYHQRFRHRALRCVPPCSWQGNPPAGH